MQETIQFITEKHKNQWRKKCQLPYIFHPLSVYKNLINLGISNPVILKSALLHDVLEDTDTTYEELKAIYGTEIAEIVLELTSDDKVYTFDGIIDRDKKAEYLISKMNNMSDEAFIIKLADRQDNIVDILVSEFSDKKWQEKYYYETRKIMMGAKWEHKHYNPICTILISNIFRILDEYKLKTGMKLVF